MPYQSVRRSINGMETKTIEVVGSKLVAAGIGVAIIASVLGFAKWLVPDNYPAIWFAWLLWQLLNIRYAVEHPDQRDDD